MLTFKNYINRDLIELIDNEIKEYGFSEEEFYALGALNEHSMVDSANLWHKMKQGAHDYFSAAPHEQHAMHKEAEGKRKQPLFTDEKSNPKLSKSGDKMPHYHTKGLFLAPSTASGVDVCPAASKECKAACLGAHSGRATMRPVKQARNDRTHFMVDHPKHFYAKLDHEITSAKNIAHKKGQKLEVRLNGTSDIPHEHLAPHLFTKHHDVQFYDYTKIHGRSNNKAMPKNYHLTHSSTGLNHKESNWGSVRKHLDKGGTASMVFKVKTGIKGTREAGKLPTHVHDEETGKHYRVVDGDEHDHRHLDHSFNKVPHGEGVIAGLRLKGGPKNLARAGHFAVDVNHEGHAVAKKGQN